MWAGCPFCQARVDTRRTTAMKKTTDFLSLVASGQGAQIGALDVLAKRALARLSHDNRAGAVSRDAVSVLGDPCAAAMAFALCDPDETAAQFLVDDLLEAGISVEDLCRHHLAPAARRLGTMWDQDRLPFTEVALATARIQSILRRLPISRTGLRAVRGPGAVFAAVPGEMHTLGVMMAADLFRRGGWDVSLFVGLTHDEMLARLTRDDRPVIGLSCSGEHSFGALRRLLAALGNARPDAQFLVAGQIIADPARIASLPVPVMVVGDLDSAEAEMARLDAVLSSSKVTRLRPMRGRSASMA